MSTQDPASFFRSMIGEWAAGQREPADGGGFRTVADQAMAAANIASRSDMEAVNERLAAIEQAILRVEQKLDILVAKKAKKAAKREG